MLLLTTVLPFLAHDHPAAAAFLTCRHHNFHSSIIPEFLSDQQRVKKFYEARQQNKPKADKKSACRNLYHLFVRTPLMQFSPSLIVFHNDFAESILKPLLASKYFTRTLQRCSFGSGVEVGNDLVQSLSKVQSLIKLDLGSSDVKNEHLEIIINSSPSLETLMIDNANCLDPKSAISIVSPPPPATKTLRNLTLKYLDPMVAMQFVPHFSNLTKLVLSAQNSNQELDLLPLASSLIHLTDLDLEDFALKNTESLNNLVHLTSLCVRWCEISALSFLTQENSLPRLTMLRIDSCGNLLSSSFAPLAHAPNLQVLEVISENFDTDCLQYLEHMVHLRKLVLNCRNITGDSEVFKALMRNLFQLEELNLYSCRIGGQGAIAGALYSSSSRLRVLNLKYCDLVDDDLNGIGALKNTLEVLDLRSNPALSNEGLMYCKDLLRLKRLYLSSCARMTDLSPLDGCFNLEELDVSNCIELSDDSFKVFSQVPNSFPYLRVLNLSSCQKLTEKVFEHLSKNNHLVYQLMELNIGRLYDIVSSSSTARENLCRLKGLRILKATRYGISKENQSKLTVELMRQLMNLEEES